MIRNMLVLVMGCICVSGCSQLPFWKKQTEKPAVAVADVRPGAGNGQGAAAEHLAGTYDGLSACRSELKTLQGVDAGLYHRNQAQLDNSLSRASQYIVMRPGLSTDMQNVMDSVYQAQIARACQQIHADLFASLLKQADGR